LNFAAAALENYN